jgi:hypothetical protein
MPKALHDKLAKSARKAGLKGERRGSYVYGTMKRIENTVYAKHRGRPAPRGR